MRKFRTTIMLMILLAAACQPGLTDRYQAKAPDNAETAIEQSARPPGDDQAADLPTDPAAEQDEGPNPTRACAAGHFSSHRCSTKT